MRYFSLRRYLNCLSNGFKVLLSIHHKICKYINQCYSLDINLRIISDWIFMLYLSSNFENLQKLKKNCQILNPNMVYFLSFFNYLCEWREKFFGRWNRIQRNTDNYLYYFMIFLYTEIYFLKLLVLIIFPKKPLMSIR